MPAMGLKERGTEGNGGVITSASSAGGHEPNCRLVVLRRRKTEMSERASDRRRTVKPNSQHNYQHI